MRAWQIGQRGSNRPASRSARDPRRCGVRPCCPARVAALAVDDHRPGEDEAADTRPNHPCEEGRGADVVVVDVVRQVVEVDAEAYLRGLVAHRVYAPERALDGADVADVPADQLDPVRRPRRVAVQIHDDRLVPGEQQRTHDRRSDEAGTAGNEDAHARTVPPATRAALNKSFRCRDRASPGAGRNSRVAGEDPPVTTASGGHMRDVGGDKLYRPAAPPRLSSRQWAEHARGSLAAALHHLPGGTAAVFTRKPESDVYNNALLAPGLHEAARVAAVDAMEGAYAEAGVGSFAAWVLEDDPDMRQVLECRGYTLDTSTLAIGMALADPARPPLPSGVELGPATWAEYLEFDGLPSRFLQAADHASLHGLVAREEGRIVAAALAYDFEGGSTDSTTARAAHPSRRVHPAPGPTGAAHTHVCRYVSATTSRSFWVPGLAFDGRRGKDWSMSGLLAASQTMVADLPQLLPAREMMAFTLGFHIVLVPFGVAFTFITLIANYRGLRLGDADALVAGAALVAGGRGAVRGGGGVRHRPLLRDGAVVAQVS